MSIGQQLRQAREEKSITLHAIAEKTNISVRFLDAIEKGQIEKLPGGIFTRGFVRSYASHVGLDPDETVRAFVAAHPALRTDDDEDERAPRDRAGAIAQLVGAGVVIALLLAGAFWWFTRTSGAVSGAANAGAVADAAPTPAPFPAAAPDVPVVQEPVAVPGESPAVSTMALRLTVSPTGRCWVQVKADGRIRLAREVLAGERVEIEAADRLEIVAGDAGAFGYHLNGSTGRALGPAGRVGRATITPDNVAQYQGQLR